MLITQGNSSLYNSTLLTEFIRSQSLLVRSESYMQKTCDDAVKAILAKKNLRKKCVNRDKM